MKSPVVPGLLIAIFVEESSVGSGSGVRGLLIGEPMLDCNTEGEHERFEGIACLQSINSVDEIQLCDGSFHNNLHTSEPPVGPKKRDIP